ncbi:MAG: hypothetical protein NT045_05405, partial [Candidatus Aureabacteria bacterium]|nr:hypothetical protein [Candidatus Auribacterota bacterium]
MVNDSVIEFRCVDERCKGVISFPMLGAGGATQVRCPGCGREYAFQEALRDKFERFARLVEAVRGAEDILGDTHVGLDIQGHSVQVPYRILLT